MTNTYPSDIHPELTQDRIRHVVALIDKARREALEHFEPAKGELARSLGLRVLERMSHILLAESISHRWLTVSFIWIPRQLCLQSRFIARTWKNEVTWRGYPESP